MNDRTNDEQRCETTDPPMVEERREFLRGLGKWSQAVIGGVLLGGALTVPQPANAQWINRRSGWDGGGSWINRGSDWGGGSWVNRRGGWNNHGGGSWYNRSGGWNNRGGGSWHNRGGGWNNRGGSWVNRR